MISIRKTFGWVLPIFTAVTIFCFSIPAAAVDAGNAVHHMEVSYAKCFSVEEVGGVKKVTVRPPWKKDGMGMILLPRGSAVPPAFSDTPKTYQIVNVPVKRIVSLSTTHLAFIDALGQTGKLAGVATFDYINTPAVIDRIQQNKLVETGHFLSLKMEVLMDLDPGIIFTPASNTIYDIHPKLYEAGLPAALVIDHLENHPLGRLEWVKFLGLFFGEEKKAEAIYKEVSNRYLATAQKTKGLLKRPKVLFGCPFKGQWWMPKGDSFVARYIKDAGGDYLFADLPGTGSAPMDIEAVYERAVNADVWINTATWKSLKEAKEGDPRFLDVPALQTGRVYNNTKRVNANGGNDYWESGMISPDVVLSDLIRIFHPQVLPDHEPVYYKKLQ